MTWALVSTLHNVVLFIALLLYIHDCMKLIFQILYDYIYLFKMALACFSNWYFNRSSTLGPKSWLHRKD